MEDIENLPPELQKKPKCLIVLTGLDADKCSFHALVLKGFASSRRTGRLAFKFRNLALDHPYLKSKPKHSSQYEWYLPKGLLKRHWMKKHLEEIPAVVIVFFDLNSGDGKWSDKVKECARRVELVRSNLVSRATKVIVTLLQSSDIGENASATDRSQELCDHCQINSKSLFILQQSELTSYINRLEMVLCDMASSYYHNAAERVIAHKASLNDTTQRLLLVRHDFKIAFFNELKQNLKLALKHYLQAYDHLLELKMPTADIIELKIVAGLINFKICRISFQLCPSNAFLQFQRHIKSFKTAVGLAELAFEHEAWLSKQYDIFGELYDEARPSSFQALIAPGLYFFEAAQHTIKRRAIATRLCHAIVGRAQANYKNGIDEPSASPVNLLTPSAPNSNSNSLPDFFGQRVCHITGQALENADSVTEREIIATLQAKEAQVDHTKLIIQLFANTSRNFERYDARRMRTYPIFYIADEFFQRGEYDQALNHYSKIVDDYRRSGWNLLFTRVCHRVFECSSKLQKFSVAILSVMELLSDHSTLAQSEKEELHRFLFPSTISPQSGLSSCAISSRMLEEGEASAIEVIDLTHSKSCVELKVQFTKSFFSIDEPVKLLVFLKSFTSLPLCFDALEVKLHHEALSEGPIAPSVAPSTGSSSSSFCYFRQSFYLTHDDHLRVFVFTLDPTALGSVVQVETVQVAITHPEGGNSVYHLCWIPSAVVPSSLTTVVSCDYIARLEESKCMLSSAEDGNATLASNLTPHWEFFVNRISAEILPKSSKLDLSLRHAPPLLCNEQYVILCQVLNSESTELSDLTVSAMLAGGGPTDSSMELSPTTLEAPQRVGVVVGQSAGRSIATASSGFTAGHSAAHELFSRAFITSCLSPGADLVCPIFVHCPVVAGDRSLRVDAHYVMPAQLPTPGATLLSWSKNGSIRVVATEGGSKSGNPASLTMTRCVQSKRVQLSVTPPFEIASRVLALKHEPITTVITGRPFLLEVTLTNCSPWSIDIEECMYDLDPGVQFKGAYNPLPKALTLDSFESLKDVQMLVVPDNSMNLDFLKLGQYIVKWRRHRLQMGQAPSFPKSSISSTTFSLLRCSLVTLPFGVDLSLPPFGLLHSPFTISYKLENKTTLPQELNVTLESTEGFAFCGVQLTSIRLLPNSMKKVNFDLLPLRSGYVRLPRFNLWSGSKLNVNSDKAAPMSKIEVLQQLQSHIFIMPHRDEASSKV